MGNRLSRHIEENREEGESSSLRNPLLGESSSLRNPLLPESESVNAVEVLQPAGSPGGEEGDEFESLDFSQIHSRILATEQRYSRFRHFYGYTGRTVAKWGCVVAIGIMTGSIAFVIERFAEVVHERKMILARMAIQSHQLLLVFFYYAGYGVAVVVTTSLIVLYYAPAAAGGGVTLVMANLNGVQIRELLVLRTLCVKILGTMCAVTSGLAVGPEGPLVHIAAAVATQFTALSARFSRLEPRSTWPISLPTTNDAEVAPIESEDYEREDFPVPAGSEPASNGAVDDEFSLLSTPSMALSREVSSASSEAEILASLPSVASSSRQGSVPKDFDLLSSAEASAIVDCPAPSSDDRPPRSEITAEPDRPPQSSSDASVIHCFPRNVLSSLKAVPERLVAPPRQVPVMAPPRCNEITPAVDPASSLGPVCADEGKLDLRSSQEHLVHGPQMQGERGKDEQGPATSALSLRRRLFPWFFRRPTEALDFHNDLDRREFISAGAAAGLAAAFGAPIGGVLFSLEEASSFWSNKVMWRSLVCTTIACLFLSWLRGSGELVRTGLLSFHSLRPKLEAHDLPFFVATASATGLLGGLFVWLHNWVAHYRVPQHWRMARILEAVVVVLVTIGLYFTTPMWFGTCLPQPQRWAEEGFGFEFLCPQFEGEPKQYNDLATLFFSLPDEAIKKLLELSSLHNSTVPGATTIVSGQTEFTMKTLTVYTSFYFIVFQLAYGMAMPGGLFMPATILGSAFGGLLGMIFDYYLPGYGIQPGHHALIGATAMLGGIFRASISLVVIMVEGTGGIDFVFPLILAVISSNYVAGHFGHMGAYESDLDKLRHIPFLHSEPPHGLWGKRVEEIMSRNVVSFDTVVRVSDVLHRLKRTRHNGFPVFMVDARRGQKPKRLLAGLILRSQIMTLLEQRYFVSYRKTTQGLEHQMTRHMVDLSLPVSHEEVAIYRAMQTYHLFHNHGNRHLSSLPDAVDALELGFLEAGKQLMGDEPVPLLGGIPINDLALDLRPYMNHAPISVRQECSVHRVYSVFRTLGLRHLPITDASSEVVGIITRKDLAKAARDDHNRMADDRSILPQPDLSMSDVYALP